jgi:hypothetical protein
MSVALKMTNDSANEPRLRPPIWADALLAAESEPPAGVTPLVEWASGPACLRFRNEGEKTIVLPKLGVKLAAGSVLDVWWPAGATRYEFQVRKDHVAAGQGTEKQQG